MMKDWSCSSWNVIDEWQPIVLQDRRPISSSCSLHKYKHWLVRIQFKSLIRCYQVLTKIFVRVAITGCYDKFLAIYGFLNRLVQKFQHNFFLLREDRVFISNMMPRALNPVKW